MHELERQSSLLKELIQGSLSSMSDSTLNSLSVVKVRLSRGKYNAEVICDMPSLKGLDEAAAASLKDKTKAKLKKASHKIASDISKETDWFKVPKLVFTLVSYLEELNSLDAIFAKLESDREKQHGVDVYAREAALGMGGVESKSDSITLDKKSTSNLHGDLDAPIDTSDTFALDIKD